MTQTCCKVITKIHRANSSMKYTLTKVCERPAAYKDGDRFYCGYHNPVKKSQTAQMFCAEKVNDD